MVEGLWDRKLKDGQPTMGFLGLQAGGRTMQVAQPHPFLFTLWVAQQQGGDVGLRVELGSKVGPVQRPALRASGPG